MNKKFTVITRNEEHNLTEVQHVEAKNPKEAYLVACQQIFEQMCTDNGIDLDDEEEKQNVIDNESLICILEGHCKCIFNAAFDEFEQGE